MLKFRVEGQKLTWENPDEVVVAGTKKYLECYFEFDGDAWSGFEYVEAFFKNGRDKPIRMLLSANRIWKEDGLCLAAGDWSVYLCATTYNAEKEEIEKQITSSSVSIRVLAHGQFEDAQNSFESPEIANQYIAAMQVFEDAREKAEDERVEAENARNVFEEYNPDKTYVKGNKVAYEGSSYVLTADEALGTNPTDTGSWLCIAEKGDKGEQGQQGIKGEKGDKGDKGASGGKIFSYALGYGKDVEVGSYKMAIPPFELIENGIDYNDIIVDTDGGCIFQYVASIGDDEAMLPAEGLHCIANPNGEKGDKGDKGKDGTLWTPLYFELDTKKGENKKAQFEFSRNIFRFGFEEYYGLYMDDYPNVYEWTAGDFFVSNNGKILQIKQLEWINSELLNADVVCISEHNLIVDQVFDGDSENAISGKALAEVLKVLSEQLAFADFSNVSNEDFRAKAEEAGVGGDDAGLADEKNFMVFKGAVDTLPETANEGEVYKPKSDYLTGKQYNNPDNFRYSVDYIGENFVVISGNLTEYFKEAYEKSTTKSGYLMFYNGEYSEEFLFTLENVEGDRVAFANADQSTLERVFSSPIEYFAIQNVLIVHKGTSAVYHNGEWVEISKDGVTKSEMESYVEETLLGGEW